MGDNGTTSLVNGKRVPKTNVRIKALGVVDELMAHLGLLKATKNTDERFVSIIGEVQRRLHDLCFAVASDSNCCITAKEMNEHLDKASAFINFLEKNIELFTRRLEAKTDWDIPGAGVVSSAIHIARTVARRAEISLWEVISEDTEKESSENQYPVMLKFYAVSLNRLSDLLFMLARADEDGLILSTLPAIPDTK